jgi:mono/diheme cytochrome c family protein
MSRKTEYVGFLLAAGLLINGPLSNARETNSPHVNYMLHCQGCHLPGGVGHPGIVPNLQDHIGLFLRNEQGRAYLVQVPGAAQSALDDSELADVLNWMLQEFDQRHVDANFVRFTSAEVERYRAVKLTAVSAARSKILAEP